MECNPSCAGRAQLYAKGRTVFDIDQPVVVDAPARIQTCGDFERAQIREGYAGGKRVRPQNARCGGRVDAETVEAREACAEASDGSGRCGRREFKYATTAVVAADHIASK